MNMDWTALRVSAAVACLFSLVFAQDQFRSECNPLVEGFDEFIVGSRESLAKISECDIVTGDVKVVWQDPEPPQSALQPYLNLNRITNITGSISFTDRRSSPDDASVTIKADALEAITGTLNFTDITQLDELTFLKLETVQDLLFDNVTFTEGDAPLDAGKFPLLSSVCSISLINTSITDVGRDWEGFSVPTALSDTPASFQAIGNRNLQVLRIPGYQQDAIDIHIEGNHENLSVDFSDITTCTLNLQDVRSFTANSLQWIGSANDIDTNRSVSETEPKIMTRQEATGPTTSGSSVTNNLFTELGLPGLTGIVGSFDLSDNSLLKTISFPDLTDILGEVTLSGTALDSIDIGSSLKFERDGQLVVQSSDSKICSTLKDANPQIKCGDVEQAETPATTSQQNGGDGNEDGDDDDDSDETSSSGGGGLSTGAKAGIGVTVGLGVPLLLLLAFFLYRRRSRRARASPRGVDQDVYVKDNSASEAATSPARYTKVRSETLTEEVGRPVSRQVSTLSYGTNQPLVSEGGRGRGRGHNAVEMEEQQGERFEMEEQQGMRHEMDARSLPDMDIDDESEERRSLDDIERSRNSGGMQMGGNAHAPPG